MRVSQIDDDDDSLDNNEDKGDSDSDLDNKNNEEEEEEEEDIVNDDKATGSDKCPAKKKYRPHPSMSLYSQLLLLLSHYCLQERHHLLWL